ncbi:TetR/AcrR family transcriptional regulator [Pantoea sp. BAV 3049]|uniref:TetR/AcrR family transcriptional regulator n=1 Tax=Pantoea sp. BAV 3049 TaxID=2654188 RepID=UPI001E4CFBCD|nr:TetR/AcrR family transcriptional regulator [Pantoea sp. BAV 3049]
MDQIAAAADVGRMTVFNHFPRKEDMFFDREEEGRETLREALLQRDRQIDPIETLRLLAHRLIAEQVPYLEFSRRSQNFVATVERSEILKARARAIRGELVQLVAQSLAESVGKVAEDPDAWLAAELTLATWTVAFIQAHRIFMGTQDSKAATTAFLRLVDQGALGVKAAYPSGF